ncbi:MAG: SDR family oxidoreductase [Phycisphaeraceae bacterium]|nr:SDR family oxidoreductase [Phycisphaeraceae bacterium]
MTTNQRVGEGRVCLVIGAAGGIGTDLCRRLAADGWSLQLAGRTVASLEALAGALPAGRAHAHGCDATRFADVDGAFDAAVSRFGRLDAAVNLAGSILLKPAHLTSEEEFARTVSANLASAFAVVRAAGRVMRAGGGSVVLLASAAGRTGLANHEAIGAAKAGVIGLVMSAAATYAGSIRVNCVAPGLVRTAMARGVLSSEAAERASVAMHAAGRLGEPGDVASMIHWLVDPGNSWVTGQVFGVDGGLATVRPRVKV